MVLVAPRSAKLVAAHGSRLTLLAGYVFLVLAFVGMLLLWNEDTPYWQIAIPYVFIGIGVGLAGTPASNSLTGSVPVRRVGMASGTADLQRDLGGALMTSILGAVLTAHYASAMADQSVSSQVSSSTEAQLQLSFASAENIAAHASPQDADAILAAAKSSFLDGDQWAYGAGLVAVLVGAVLVFFVFPKARARGRAPRLVSRRGHCVRVGMAGIGCRRGGETDPRSDRALLRCGRGVQLRAASAEGGRNDAVRDRRRQADVALVRHRRQGAHDRVSPRSRRPGLRHPGGQGPLREDRLGQGQRRRRSAARRPRDRG